MDINKTTLVIVDDDVAHSVLIQRHLKKIEIDYEIVSLQSGQQALDFVFSEGDFRGKTECLAMLMILDINMPGINGVEVLKKIKSSELTRHIPIIMFTTADDPKEIDDCYKLGCNAYIVKPVDHAGFVEKIRELGAFLKISQHPRFE